MVKKNKQKKNAGDSLAIGKIDLILSFVAFENIDVVGNSFSMVKCFVSMDPVNTMRKIVNKKNLSY